MDEKYMKKALQQANIAYKENEIPVGAIIVRNNKIIASAYNKREKTNKITAHAELIAIEKACKKIKSWRLNDCTIYTTLFPCPMCASAIQQSRIKKIVYLTENNNKHNSKLSYEILTSPVSNHYVEIEKSNLESDVLNIFFKKIRKESNVSRETYD